MQSKNSLRLPVSGRANRHSGATLIGLMIGLLVSMIGILGSLSLYKTLTQTSVDATFDTKHDGNAAIALSRAAREIQSAGFGLPAPQPADATWPVGIAPHLIIIDPQQIIWRSGNAINAGAANVTCKRLIDVPATAADLSDNIQGRKLLLETTDNVISGGACDDISNLANLVDARWANATQEVLNITALTRLDVNYSQTNVQPLIQFQLAPLVGAATCAPYGMVPTGQATLINIAHYSSVDLNLPAIPATPSLSYDVCIGNPVF